ncbi:MAG: adenosine deaminase [Actinomycetota bacterium]
MDLRALAKVELHRHLEGSVRLSTIIDLHREAGLDLPAWTPEELAPHALVMRPVESLEVALQAFGYAQRSFTGLDAVRRIAREAVEDLAADNVRLAELRFSPGFMCAPANLDWEAGLDAVLGGVQEAVAAGSDVAVGLLVIFSRDLGMESAARTVELTLTHRDVVAGFDIAGPEVGFPPSTYAAHVRRLLDAGVHVTLHYGESGPPPYPREAIELGVRRLGHGLSVALDPSVTALARERGVTLEMCPTSNWLTQGVGRVADHPVRRLLHEGVRVTLNTDDPGLMGIDLTHEYEAARSEIGFDESDFAAAVRNSLDASFLPPDVVADVRARHFSWAE